MITTLNRRIFLAGATAMTVAGPAFAAGTNHDVKMLNAHPENRRLRNIFLPRLLKIQPGDTVTFLATDRGHDSVSMDGMLPEGAEPWKGKINEEIVLTLTIPGVYGYKCVPHYSLGMIGLIIVEGEGMADNLEAAREVRQRGRARTAFDEIWAEVDEQGLLTPAS